MKSLCSLLAAALLAGGALVCAASGASDASTVTVESRVATTAGQHPERNVEALLSSLPLRREPLRHPATNAAIEAADFGIKPDTGENMAPALKKLTNHLATPTDPTTVSFEKGVYHVSGRLAALDFSSLRNLVIGGRGADFFIQLPGADFTRPTSRKNTIFRNLAVGGDLLPFTQEATVAVTIRSAPSIKLGETELLYPADELPIRYDGSLSTIQKEKDAMHFFHSWGCRGKSSAHTWHYGPPDDPLRHLEMNKSEEELWDYNGYYQNKEMDGIWILGMYKRDNGDILAITHSEVRDFPGGMENQWFALGLGYSTDGGKSFTFCGEIVTPANKHHNVGGGPYILVEDYIYVYFNDRTTAGKRRICVARAPLKEVLEAAEKHQVTKWFKHRDKKWDVPALYSGMPGSSVIPIVYGGEDVHSDAAYCTALGRYLMTVQTHAANRLLLFSSKDGLNWEREADVDHAPGYLQAYSSFVDYDGPAADCSEVDGDFYIYWPRRLLKGVHNNTMFRRRVMVE